MEVTCLGYRGIVNVFHIVITGFTITDQTLRFLSPSGCCIISDGLDRGMTKIAGEAVRDYTEAYGGDHMVMVGVASSEHVAFRELFKASNASQVRQTNV